VIEAAAIDGASFWTAVLDHRLPAPVADHLLPAGGQRRLRLLRYLRRHPHHHLRAARSNRDDDPGLQGLSPTASSGRTYGSSAAQSVVLIALVTILTVVQFRFIERRVHY
jgi:sn-glycerol 3-phosphate transport system permease protein